MAHQGVESGDDLFLELAEGEEEARPTSRDTMSGSRLSHVRQRLSLNRDGLLGSALERRGSLAGSRKSANADDSGSLSGRPLSPNSPRSARPQSRLTTIRSPELPSYGRRRPSFAASGPEGYAHNSNKAQDSPYESSAEKSERVPSVTDSTSADSQPDTVWDELDDLKSRIKKLELTGKLPSGMVSGDSSERPRTATTAPTTIGSSPKHERKTSPETALPAMPQLNTAVTSPTIPSIHPLLHQAMAKAKPLIGPGLYRSLEATATEALQLAAMTGSAGPQGTTYSAASVINGATVSDRHVRRKADNMCRNLTDLCLALCDGKNETPSAHASPVALHHTPTIRSSPTIRYSRSSMGMEESARENARNGQGRTMSRLEARRNSILGSQAVGNFSTSPRETIDDGSSDFETTSSQAPRSAGLRRVSRASSRLRPHGQRFDEANDEDPTMRPPSRAMTDIGGLRSQHYSTPTQHRSPTLRESLIRRANSTAHGSNRDYPRLGSLNNDPSTPVLQEEESSESSGYHPSFPRSKRRMASMSSSFNSRLGAADIPRRSASISSRRAVLAE